MYTQSKKPIPSPPAAKQGTNRYSQIPGENPYASNAFTGGWIRVVQPDGSLRFVFNSEISSQAQVDQLYKDQDATYMGKGSKVRDNKGQEYILMANGEAKKWLGKKGLGESVEPSSIIGQTMIPQFSSGFYDGVATTDAGEKVNIDVKAYFKMANLSEEEQKRVRIIQVVYSDSAPHKEGLGSIDGKLAFVDGGINSAMGREAPWYHADNDFRGMDRNFGETSMSFKLSDQPGTMTQKTTALFLETGPFAAMVEHEVYAYHNQNFESYVVIDNYQNSGKIKIIGRVDWGFTTENGKIEKTIDNPVMVPAENFSTMARKIWDKDYGASQWKLFDEPEEKK